MGQRTSAPNSEAAAATDLDEEGSEYDIIDSNMGLNASKSNSEPTTAAPEEEQPKEPVVYLLGRKGHGKSSLVSALANEVVAQERYVSTTSIINEKWNVTFVDGTSCILVESHDIFELSNKVKDSFTSKLEKDLTEYEPSAILYLLSCSEVESAAKEFQFITTFFKSKRGKWGDIPPVFVVLTKADAFFDTRLWPIEEHTDKQTVLTELLEYVGKEMLAATTLEPIQKDALYYGYTVKGCEPIQGVLPITTLSIGEVVRWNIDILHTLLLKSLCTDNQPYDFHKDIADLQKVVDEVKGLFEDLCTKNDLVGVTYQACRQAALQPVVEFLEDLIENARAPIVYLMGRSGHGKSSLINALTNSEQAEVGHVKPTTPESVQYDIVFEGQNTSWKIVDSRGIFESTTAAGAPNKLATKQVEEDLKAYKPDIILHVINCSEARNLAADLKFVNEVFKAMKSEFGSLPPVIVVLTKADVFYHHLLWPIEEHANKQKALEELLDYMSTPILSSGSCQPLDPSSKYYGCQLKGCEPFLYVVPVATLLLEPSVIWNITRLNELIGKKLPLVAWLHYYKTQKREKKMKDLSFKVVNQLAEISYVVGTIPIPGVSFVFLMPLYVVMISVIAKLAGREFSTNNAKDFLISCKTFQIAATATTAVTFLAMAEMIESSLFGAGWVISACMTQATTYGVGRSAIDYFFDNEIKPPASYKKEWTPPHS